MGARPAREPTTTMRPHPRSRMPGSTARTTESTPKKLVSSWARARASDVSSTLPKMP